MTYNYIIYIYIYPIEGHASILHRDRADLYRGLWRWRWWQIRTGTILLLSLYGFIRYIIMFFLCHNYYSHLVVPAAVLYTERGHDGVIWCTIKYILMFLWCIRLSSTGEYAHTRIVIIDSDGGAVVGSNKTPQTKKKKHTHLNEHFFFHYTQLVIIYTVCNFNMSRCFKYYNIAYIIIILLYTRYYNI